MLALPTSTSSELHCVLLGDKGDESVLTRVTVPAVSEISRAGECILALHQRLCPSGVKSQKLIHADSKNNAFSFALMSNQDGNCLVRSFFLTTTRVFLVQMTVRVGTCSPEDCVDVTLLSVSLPVVASAEKEMSVPLCIGLSSRHRLYCGEFNLASGVDSYAINEGMGVLLYVTIGTSPHLHFISLRALAALDPDLDIEQEEGAFQLLEVAPARPVERC